MANRAVRHENIPDLVHDGLSEAEFEAHLRVGGWVDASAGQSKRANTPDPEPAPEPEPESGSGPERKPRPRATRSKK